MAKKTLDPKAKAKRQKIIAGVGGVLLLGLLAFQVPRTLKMLHQGENQTASTTASTSTTPASGAPLAPPSLDGSAPSGTPAPGSSASGLADAAAAPATSGQLVSFSRFRTKDPFAQQVKADCGANCAGSATSRPTVVLFPLSPTAPVASARTTPRPATPAVALTTATISVDGVSSVVRVGASFPQGQSLFQLVSLTKASAKITVVGGSFEGGAPVLVLRKGKQVTLMNTADGVRYVLKLLAVGS